MSQDTLDDELRTVLTDAGLDKLAAPLTKAVRVIAERTAGTVAEPLRAQHRQQLEADASREAAATMKEFQEAHPDWAPGNDVDKAMAACAAKVAVKRDATTGKALMSDRDYLETVHAMATKDRRTEPRASVERREEPEAAPEEASFDDAYRAAKRGVRWDGPGRTRRIVPARSTHSLG